MEEMGGMGTRQRRGVAGGRDWGEGEERRRLEVLVPVEEEEGGDSRPWGKLGSRFVSACLSLPLRSAGWSLGGAPFDLFDLVNSQLGR
jgi:hypothetical protein